MSLNYHDLLCEQRRQIRLRIGNVLGIIPISKSMDILLNRVDVIRHAVRQSLLP